MRFFFQLFVFFLPTQLVYHFWPEFSFIRGIRVDYFSPTIYFSEIILFVVFFLWLKKDESVVKRVLKNWRALLPVAVFIAGNIYVSEIRALTFYKWLRVFELFGLFYFVKHQKQVLGLIKVPIASSLAFTLVVAVAQMLKGASLGGILYFAGERTFSTNSPDIALFNFFGREMLRPYATFAHPNALAGYALVCLFLYVKNGNLVDKTIVALSLFLVVISISQNAWLALLFVPVVYFVGTRIKEGFAKFFRVAALASLFLTILTAPGASEEIAQRAELNFAAGKIISDNPIFGAGLGTFISHLPTILSPKPIWFLQPVHNIFLLVAAECGLVGLLFFVYFLGKSVRSENAMAVVAIVLTGLFDHYWLSIFQNSMLAALVLAI